MKKKPIAKPYVLRLESSDAPKGVEIGRYASEKQARGWAVKILTDWAARINDGSVVGVTYLKARVFLGPFQVSEFEPLLH